MLVVVALHAEHVGPPGGDPHRVVGVDADLHETRRRVRAAPKTQSSPPSGSFITVHGNESRVDDDPAERDDVLDAARADVEVQPLLRPSPARAPC